MPYTYGNDPNHFVEIPDPDRANQTIRPAPGLVVELRDHDTMAALPDVTTAGYGYLAFTSDARSVRASTDGFATFKVLRGQEALDAAIASGTAASVDLTAVNEALAGKANTEDPAFTGTVTLNGTPLPTNVVEANVPNARLVFPPAADPDADGAYEITVIPGERALELPATKPATEQVVTVKPDGTQGSYALASLTAGTATTTSPGGGTSVQATARRILAAATGQERINTLGVHPAPPTVTFASGLTTGITGGIRIPLKRRSATLIDVGGDPHFDFPGQRPDTYLVSGTEVGRADYLTGGASQSRRDHTRIRTVFAGQVIEFILRATTNPTRYRVWVDGMPLTIDQQAPAATVGNYYRVVVDFGAPALGPRTIELEMNDPWHGGAYIGPTDTITRYRTPRAAMTAFGDSHTAGANGVVVGDTWPTWAARLLGVDVYNMGIGGSGFLLTAGGGTVAPNFRARINPDVVSVRPDLVVFAGGYNDIGAATATAIQTEAQACYDQLRTALPGAVIIAAGPFWQNHTIGAALKAQDNAQRAAALAVGIPFISYIDPTGATQAGGAPAWAASTAYAVGDTVVNANAAWKARAAHTSGTTFDATQWRATTFVNGTGRSTALAGNGNADVIISSDGIHATAQGHKIHGYWLASEVTRVLRDLAA